VGDERGGRPPADEPDAAHVRLREAAALELGPDDRRDVSPAERLVDQRHVGRLGRATIGHLPAERVENLPADQHPVSHHAVTGRRQPRGDRREGGGGGRRHDGRDRAALQAAEDRQLRAGGVDGAPAEPVEHEQDDRAGVGHAGRQPRRRVRAEQGRHDRRHRGAGVVGPHHFLVVLHLEGG
jgi:hypothetical protein